jgi:hypothetical protein
MDMVNKTRDILDARLHPRPDGYNVEFNAGFSAARQILISTCISGGRRSDFLERKPIYYPLKYCSNLPIAKLLRKSRLTRRVKKHYIKRKSQILSGVQAHVLCPGCVIRSATGNISI